MVIVFGPFPAMAHSERIIVEVSVRPAEPVPNEEVAIKVSLSGAKSRLPTPGAEITAIADMPVHKMKPVNAALSRGEKPNEHTGKLRFTMPGAWEVTLKVLHEGERDQAKFKMEVKPPTAEQRDQGVAKYRVGLDFPPPSGTGYPWLVLIGSVLFIVLLVGAAWISKNYRKPTQSRGP
jgi:hypothetical protein